ncbi:hypothetical protein B296_00041739 [Ensete ventricosum]|uniref:Uncharacterized protein n=1 Tax=Ensete ventricosum TaxID=4639 RepID=A0A426WYR0_ENSVE|nr:hypothetical protein B296_00041739 [Ensete ventricosum]
MVIVDRQQTWQRGDRPRPDPLQGWLAMARPLASAATDDQAGYSNSRLQPRPPVRGRVDAAGPDRRSSSHPRARPIAVDCRGARKGRPALPPVGQRLQGRLPTSKDNYRRARAVAAYAGAATVA